MNRSTLRLWIGLAFLSISWMAGLGYYHDVDWMTWLIFVALGVIAVGPLVQNIASAEGWLSVALLAPAVALAPWPYKIALIFMMVGIALVVAPASPRWVRWCGSALLSAGIILLVQGLAMLG